MATVTFYNASAQSTGFQVFLGENCTQRRLVISPLINISGLAPKEKKTLTFQAGVPFSFEFNYGISSSYEMGVLKSEYCQIISTFTPEAGSYRIETSLGTGDCGVAVMKQTNGVWSPIDANKLLQKRSPNTAFLNDGPWCM